jgi:hypothetical protein
MKEKIPCCSADALQHIKKIDVGGIVVGLSMLDEVIGEVQALNLPDESDVRAELLKRVKLYNYVPKSAEEVYASALLRECRSARKEGSGTVSEEDSA